MTPDELEIVAELWNEQGLTQSELEKMFGRSMHSPLARLRNAGRLERRAKAPASQEMLDEITRLWNEEGLTESQIEEELGKSARSAIGTLRHHGALKRRYRSRPVAFEWDEDMDWILKELDRRHLTYNACAAALSVAIGFEVDSEQVKDRLRLLGFPPRKQRGKGIQNLVAS